jgi:hypothetical protein
MAKIIYRNILFTYFRDTSIIPEQIDPYEVKITIYFLIMTVVMIWLTKTIEVQTCSSASEHFDVNAIDGSIKHRSVTDTVTQWNMTSPGFLKYHSMQMGHETISEYRWLLLLDDGTRQVGWEVECPYIYDR